MSNESNTWLSYELLTGRITNVITGAAREFEQQSRMARLMGRGLVASPSIDVARHYVELSTGKIVPKSPAPTSLADLPIPCTVEIISVALNRLTTHTITDGSLEYEDMPGRYKVRVVSVTHEEAMLSLEIVP